MTKGKIPHVIDGLDAWNRDDFGTLLGRVDGEYSKLVKAHTPLVLRIARAYYLKYNGVVDFPDLVREGIMVLYNGMKKFDPSRGVKFSSYIHKGLRRGMEKRILEDTQTIWIPFGRAEDFEKLRGASVDFYKLNGRTPTPEELEKSVRVHNISRQSLDMFVNKAVSPVVSLDGSPGGFDKENGSLYDSYPSEQRETPLDIVENRNERERLIMMADRAELNSRQRYIFFSLTGACGYEKKTLSEIGTELKITRERVRQLKNRVIEKVRDANGIIVNGDDEDEETSR